jgi:hypothetical protein
MKLYKNKNKNKEQIKEQSRIYYQENKDKEKEKITCDCGSCVRKGYLSQHYKSKKHQKYLALLQPQ